MKKTILITGGTGYIGSHAVVAFEQAGYKTVIVDNLVNSSVKTLTGIQKILGYTPEFFEVDLRNKASLKEIFQKYEFDGVLHFAGLKAVGESCQKPLEYFDNNIGGSLALFEMMKEFGVKKIIFSSSATVYKPKLGLRETDAVGECSNPYGTTKYLLENILSDLAKYSGFQVANLRYFNPIGAHKSGYLGESPNGIPNNLLPYVMKVATGEYEMVKVFGDDYETKDGTGVRDYIDVMDLIDGHLKAYEFLNERPLSQPFPSEEKGVTDGIFEVINLGTGRGTSVLEIVNAVQKVTGKNISYQIFPRREGDLSQVYCVPEKAKNILHWQAQTSLEESITNMWKFYNNNS